MRVYKVVDGKTRYGSNVTMWRVNNMDIDFDKYVKDNCLEEYVLKYDIGAELKCAPNSPGIMCFYTIKDAENFIESYSYFPFNFIIIQVEGEGLIYHNYFRGVIGCGAFLNRLHKRYNSEIKSKGMVTFKKVTVLS